MKRGSVGKNSNAEKRQKPNLEEIEKGRQESKIGKKDQIKKYLADKKSDSKSNRKKKKDDVQNRKERSIILTENVSLSDKWLDSLAVLLASQDECAAITVINNALYVTTNSLHSKIRISTNRNFQTITNILKYFEKLSNGALLTEESWKEARKRVFVEEICSYKRLSSPLKTSKSIILSPQKENKENPYLKAAEGILTNKEAVIAGIERVSKGCGYAIKEYLKLYEFLGKVERIIKKTIVESRVSCNYYGVRKRLTADQLNALKKDAIIIMEDNQTGVHAEMRMLSYIVREFIFQQKVIGTETNPQKIYIGISKFCCECCYQMLRAANDVFKSEKIHIELVFQGVHALSFEGWECPELFLDGFYDCLNEKKAENSLELAYQIGFLGAKKIKFSLDTSLEPKSVHMDFTPSPPTETEDDIGLKALQNRYREAVKKGQSDEIGKLGLAIQLNELQEFRAFLSLGFFSKPSDLEGSFESIFMGLHKKMEKEFSLSFPNRSQVLEILRNPDFVGEAMSDLFKEFTLEKPSSLVDVSLSNASSANLSKSDSLRLPVKAPTGRGIVLFPPEPPSRASSELPLSSSEPSHHLSSPSLSG